MHTKEMYINIKQVKEKYSRIYIYGAGVDGKRLCDALDGTEIVALIDNNRGGEGYCINGKEVMGREIIDSKEEGVPIVIATRIFAMEIVDYLIGKGMIAGKDFFVWDEDYHFHRNTIITEYIEFNSRVWKPYKVVSSENEVLMSLNHNHYIAGIVCPFFANYFATKKNAKIVAFSRYHLAVDKMSTVIKDIAKSYNVSSILDYQISEDQEKETNRILHDIWSNIKSWEDWKNISVYGIEMGTTIIRSILRYKLPTFDATSLHMKGLLAEEIKRIVYWNYYFKTHKVCAVLLDDGVTIEGYVRELAIAYGIQVYGIDNDRIRRLNHNYCAEPFVKYYKEFWNSLSEEEKQYGLAYSKKRLMARLKGDTSDIPYMQGSTPYKNNDERAVIYGNNSIKLLICPHVFDEDSYDYGEQLFDNNYISWLQHLGELSNRYTSYDWYLKPHPNSSARDYMILEKFVKEYPKIKLISSSVSPVQLKDKGIKYALTVRGTLGHEYPLVGISVINAGVNPHIGFGFNYNPVSKKEFDLLIDSLEGQNPIIDIDEIFQFYAIHYLFYDKSQMDYRKYFFKGKELNEDIAIMSANGSAFSCSNYDHFLKEINEERVSELMKKMDVIVEKINAWREDYFYKKDIR